MMFGTRDRFNYFQCSQCGCLQISEIPADMSKYYPPDYYSFSMPQINPFKAFIKKQRDEYAVFNKGIIGRLLYMRFPDEILRSLANIQLTKTSNILDVGCGQGSLLYSLMETGCQNLSGIDPNIAEDIEYGNGLKIHKKSIHDIDGIWDLIMFHHSFEHIPDPVSTLQTVSKLLSHNGVCLIRIPVVSSYAWEHYGINWVQLDAPRHFYLHSVKSMEILARKANLDLEKIIYDSNSFQFWGSLQYEKDIPLVSEKSYKVNPSVSMFSAAEITEFEKKAKELNIKKQGDQAIFYLRKKYG